MQLYQQRDHMISSGLLIEIDLPFDNKKGYLDLFRKNCLKKFEKIILNDIKVESTR